GTAPTNSYSDTGLTPNTSYTYTVVALDAAGNLSGQSNQSSVTTLAADITPPTVSMTAPANGATVSSIISLSATAADNIAVASVSFKIDGNVVGTNVSSPYTFSWDSTSVSNGVHTVTATAVDTSGNQATAGSVSVIVANVAIPRFVQLQENN